MNSKKLNVNTYLDELNRLTEGKSLEQIKSARVNLRCINSTKMGLISRCKMELRTRKYSRLTFEKKSEKRTLDLAKKLVFYANELKEADSIDRMFWEQKFFKIFPSSFLRMEELFGYDEKSGPAPLYEKEIANLVLGTFKKLETIEDSLYFDKYIRININGNWQADNIGFGFYIDDQIYRRPQTLCNALNNFDDEAIKSVFRFVFDGPNPVHWENLKVLNALKQSFELHDTHLAELLQEAFDDLVEVKGEY